MTRSCSSQELLGDKTAARHLAERAGVPIVPGTEEALTDPATAQKVAEEIGFPLIVKAAFGGRWTRHARGGEARRLRGQAGRSAQGSGAAFGNDAVFLEEYIRRALHIEVEILGDQHGNLMHLFERDCSSVGNTLWPSCQL